MFFILSLMIQFSFSFTDTDLSAALEDSVETPAIIYTITPYMPLSILGLEEVIEYAAKHQYNVIVLQDPFLRNGEYETMKKVITADSIKSKTLIARGLLDHYPSYTFLDHGKIVGPSHLGYVIPGLLEEIASERF